MVDIQLHPNKIAVLRQWTEEMEYKKPNGTKYSLQDIYTNIIEDFIEEIMLNKEIEEDERKQ
jgi:hypothetical protein